VNLDLPKRLASRLQEPLPSWAAQAAYQPELSFGRHRGPAEFGSRPAAVLIALYPRNGAWHIPLILRPKHMIDHAGQVSFPGGAIDPGETGREAAFREFHEELGVPTDGVQVIGRLSDLYLFASNFQIEAWVAALGEQPRFAPSQHEVERVLEVPLSHLIDPANSGTFERQQGGICFRAPCFFFESQRIWGATSMVLAELLAVLTELAD
jgi:8-oxo-dGTP pyrophosphatase MutT (NUDIX family)